jgi:hypothetical protein
MADEPGVSLRTLPRRLYTAITKSAGLYPLKVSHDSQDSVLVD